MFPAFYIGNFQVSLYGLLIVVGFGAGTLAVLSRTKLYGIKREDIFYALLFGAIGLAVGGKVVFLLTILPDLIENWTLIWSTPDIWMTLLTGGFVFYGGLIGFLGMILLYVRMYHLSFRGMLETITPGIPLAHAIGRVGCFCAGCCYGIPFPKPIGMEFNASPAAPHGVSLFPVQLLEAGLNLLLFLFLFFFCRKRRDVSAAGIYLIGYSIMRFGLEYLRYDGIRGFFLGLSTSQWFSLALLPAGIALCILAKKKPLPAAEPTHTQA